MPMEALPTTEDITAFVSLNALQCDQLARLIMGSITYNQEDTDTIDSTAEAIKLCEQTLNILHTIQIQTKNKNLYTPSTKMKLSLSTKPNRLSNLPRDNLFDVCDYLDSFGKARLRFTSMTTHIDMMGCSLDFIDIEWRCSSWSLLEFAKAYAPLKFIKRQARSLCGCDASRQLQLIDFGTAEVNQTLCSDLTESQLSLLGIGRSWSVTGINCFCDEGITTADFMEMCDILNKHNAFRSIKRLEFCLSEENQDVIDALSTCGIAGYVEDFFINAALSRSESPVNLSILLPSLIMLRRVDMSYLSIDGSLNDFVTYSPQIEELTLTDTDITGDISCLAQLRNIKKIKIDTGLGQVQKVHGDISSLSLCTKLIDLSMVSDQVTGNISSLTTLTNLEKLCLHSTPVKGKMESLLKYVPKIRHLALWNNSNLHLDLSSLTQLTNLKEIDISKMPHVKGDISLSLLSDEIEKPNVCNCPQVRGSIMYMYN